MLSSQVFRFARPVSRTITSALKMASVQFTDTPFVNDRAMAPINRGLFDVIASNGMILNRREGLLPDYWFEAGLLKVRVPGSYTLRVFENPMAFEGNIILVGNQLVDSDGGAFKVGIPFWPQVLSQPVKGVARVASDGKNLCFVSQGVRGQDSFAYRYVNDYGQVSEPACVLVTSV